MITNLRIKDFLKIKMKKKKRIRKQKKMKIKTENLQEYATIVEGKGKGVRIVRSRSTAT